MGTETTAKLNDWPTEDRRGPPIHRHDPRHRVPARVECKAHNSTAFLSCLGSVALIPVPQPVASIGIRPDIDDKGSADPPISPPG